MKARSPSDLSTSADSADRASGGGRPRVARRTAGVLLLCAAAGVLLVSCGDDRPPPTPEPAGTAGPSRIIETPEPPPTTEAPEGTRTTSTTSTTEADEPRLPAQDAELAAPAPPDGTWPTSADAGLEFELDGDTPWQEVFDALTAAERSCIRDALGDDMMEWFPETSVQGPEGGDGVWLLLPCIEPRLAEFLIIDTMRAGIEEADFTPGADELACLREWVAGIDRESVAESVSGGDPGVLAEISSDMTACVPDFILGTMLLGFGVDLDELGDDEQACLRDWAAGFDWAALDDTTGSGGVMSGLVTCVPDLLLHLMLADGGMELDELTDDERACLRDLVAGIDWASLDDPFETDMGAIARLTAGMMSCVPDVFLAGVLGTGVQLDDLSTDEQACLRNWMSGIDWTELEDSLFDDNFGLLGEGPATCLTDDHADSPSGATAVDVGEPVEGTLGYVDDVDYFVFEAEEGLSYEIDVTLGTLSDSLLTLYGADEWELAHNDDTADSLASRLHWTAPESGDYYVEVAGFDSGSYTLTVTASEGGGATYSLDA